MGDVVVSKQEIEKKPMEDATRADTIQERIKPVKNSFTSQVFEAGIAIFGDIPGITIEQNSSFHERDNYKRSYFILNEGTESKETKCQVQIDLFPGGKINLEMLDADGVTSKRASGWNISERDERPLSAPQEVELRAPDKQVAVGHSILQAMGWWFAKNSPAFAEGFGPAMALIQQTCDPVKAAAAKEAIEKLKDREARSWEPGYQPGIV